MKIEKIQAASAPVPLGNYSHAVAYNGLVFLSGIASRDPVTNQVPGLVMDAEGRRVAYDIEKETRATLQNIETILREAGSDLAHVLDVTVFLTDMRDFPVYNRVYGEFFGAHRPARTTLGVSSLPGNISIEIKVVAVQAHEKRSH